MTQPELSATTETEARVEAPGLGVAQVILRPRKARPFFGRHPWVLQSAVERIEGTAANGDVVDLLTDTRKFIARGIYNDHSKIRVRLYSWSSGELLDGAFWQQRLTRAIQFRQQLGLDQPNGAARLVFSEADGLSGLIVDRYGQYLVLQVTGLALAKRLDTIIPMLAETLRPRGILVRTERGLAQTEGIELTEGLAWGELPEGPVFIEEHGLRYGVDLSEGQKTGFYLDQRDNRRVAASYCRGRRVLDMFCYSGGFALNAAQSGGASEVLGFDTSHKAVTLARANAELNGVPNVHFDAGDGFEVLDTLIADHQRFGAVVLDPPKFARSRQGVDEALMAYHRLNRSAVDLLEPGGILITCSCSGHVTREDFMFMLVGVAQRTGRDIQVLEQRGAAPDHPVSATCLETEYLKCFICRVT